MAGRLQALWQALRLVGSLPGVMIEASWRYRAFERQFIRSAVAQSLPEAQARALARRLRPAQIARDLQPRQKNRLPPAPH